jgi:hypothetical protein
VAILFRHFGFIAPKHFKVIWPSDGNENIDIKYYFGYLSMISVAVIPTCKLTECDLECSVSGHTNNIIRAKSLFVFQYEFLWTLEFNIHLSLKAEVNIVSKVYKNSQWPQQKTIIVYYHTIRLYYVVLSFSVVW